MTTVETVALVLNSVELEANEQGDILQFQEVVLDASDDEDDQTSCFRFIWNDDETQPLRIPVGTKIDSLINKAREAGWYK